MLEFLRRRLAELIEQRGRLQADLEAILVAPEAEKRDLNDAEQAVFTEARAKVVAKDAEIDQAQARIKDAEDDEARAAKVAEARAKLGEFTPERPGGSAKVNEPDVYVKGGPNSYFRDMFAATTTRDTAATDRLNRHGAHLAEKRAVGNTNAAGGSGGEWAPPEWVVNEWINIIRPGRITANLFTHEDVPVGISSLNYPKLLTGTTVALQSTQNSALSSTDPTTGYVQTGFSTLGGKNVISQQLIDQGRNFDGAIVSDLGAAYAAQVGTQVFTGTGDGTGTNAIVNGLGAATIGSTVTWTQASPTPAGFYGQAGKLLAAFLAARLMPPTCWVMNPRRWYWLASSVDGNGRPLVVPNGQAFNTMGTQSDASAPMGMVGTFHGLPVFIDPLVPTTTNTNQDVVYLLKTDDLVLLESAPQVEVFREPYADSLGVLIRLYAYVATILNRHTQSIGIITGTGLTTPTFAS